MKPIHGRDLKRQLQKGFTLVELAIVLVIAGIILVGVLKGTDAINKAKVERMVADLKGLQGTILEYQKRNNRLPGDCNNDGLIGFSFVANAVSLRVNKLYGNVPTTSLPDNNAVTDRRLPVDPNGAIPARATCINTTTPSEDNIDLMWNELRRAGVVDDQRLPFELARHVMDDGYLVGAIRDANQTISNVIVVYGIPVWMAEAIDAEIDGQAHFYGDNDVTGPANMGRVRLWATGSPGSSPMNIAAGTIARYDNTTPNIGQYGLNTRSRDDLVSISYQFDTRKLPY
jgi:prepilin-type N-terminal cleavage/methylation domain-containing protein